MPIQTPPDPVVLPSETETPHAKLWREYRQDDRTLQDVIDSLYIEPSEESTVGDNLVRNPPL